MMWGRLLDFLKCRCVYVRVGERRKCQWLLSIMSLFIFNGVYWSLRSTVVSLCVSEHRGSRPAPCWLVCTASLKMHAAPPQEVLTPLGPNLLSGKYQVTWPKNFTSHDVPSHLQASNSEVSSLFNEGNHLGSLEIWTTVLGSGAYCAGILALSIVHTSKYRPTWVVYDYYYFNIWTGKAGFGLKG